MFSFNIDDKDKTIETFKFLAETSQILVRLNFIELGKQVEWLDKTGKNILQQIIDAPEVLDNCSKNPYQPLFISENPCYTYDINVLKEFLHENWFYRTWPDRRFHRQSHPLFLSGCRDHRLLPHPVHCRAGRL